MMGGHTAAALWGTASGTCSILLTALLEEMDMATWVQILDDAVCILHNTNALEKYMH